MTTMHLRGGVDLSIHGIHPTGEVDQERLDPAALRARDRARRGADRRGRADGRRHRHAHRPLAAGQVRRPRAGLRGPDLVGGQQGARRGDVRPLRDKVTDFLGRRGRRCTSSTRSPARILRTASRCASSRRIRTTRSSRRPCSSIPSPTSSPASHRRRLCCTRPALEAVPDEDGTRTGTFIVLHPVRTEVLIGGTFYAGEIKKSIFTVMNDRLPLEGVFRCTARPTSPHGRATSPSSSVFPAPARPRSPRIPSGADRRRRARLGRRRHLQLRGRLLREGDPPLRRRRSRDLQDDAHVRDDPRERRYRRARRGRPRRRLDHREHARGVPARVIANAHAGEARGHPSNVILLTADAFGVLPPVARLSREQALYYFLSATRRSSPARNSV